MNDYDALSDYLKKQTLPELVLSFDQSEHIFDPELPLHAHPAPWRVTLRRPQPKLPLRTARHAAGQSCTDPVRRQYQ